MENIYMTKMSGSVKMKMGEKCIVPSLNIDSIG